MDKTDPGIHYQLFTAYSRLKRREDAERELAIFKRLEEARKKSGDGANTGDGGSSMSAGDEPMPPPPAGLPEPATVNVAPKTP
jgi:hypothetical protein